MSVADRAVEWALRIARDDSHGYDQGGRWGPDYDCSSLIISAYKAAGVPLTCTYTGDMKRDMILHGFVEVPTSVLKAGDVLLNETHHTAMYIGNGQIVHAAGNEHGGATGGLSGDQTGREICIAPYYVPSYGWDCALRYTADQVPIHPNPVQPPAESATGCIFEEVSRVMRRYGESPEKAVKSTIEEYRRAAATRSEAASRVTGLKVPTAFTCAPGLTMARVR